MMHSVACQQFFDFRIHLLDFIQIPINGVKNYMLQLVFAKDLIAVILIYEFSFVLRTPYRQL